MEYWQNPNSGVLDQSHTKTVKKNRWIQVLDWMPDGYDDMGDVRKLEAELVNGETPILDVIEENATMIANLRAWQRYKWNRPMDDDL